MDEPDIMESRNFITAREMIADGNWIIPTMNGELRLEKPPLPTWITAAIFSQLKTNNLFVLRIPAALIATVMVFLFYGLVLTISSDALLAFISSIVLSTTFMIMKVGTTNSWDIYPYAFMMGALNSLLNGFQKNRKKHFILSGIFLSLSFLSKGPVGFYSMLLPFLFSYILIFKTQEIFKNKINLAILIIVALVLSYLWPLIVYFKFPDVFTNVIKKEASTWSNKHVQPYWFYLNVFAYTGVWIAFSITTLFKSFMEKRVKNRNLYYFSYIWFLTAFVLLSLIPMKKERYGIPLYIPMALMIAQLLYFFISRSKEHSNRKIDDMVIKFHSIFMSCLAFSVPVLFYLNGVLKNEVSILNFIFILILFTLLGSAFIVLIRKKSDFKMIFIFTSFLILSLQVFTYSFFQINMRGNTMNPKFTLVEVQKNKLLQEYNFYTFTKKVDIRDVWLVGKKITAVNELELNSLEYPIVVLGENTEKWFKSLPENFKKLKEFEFFESRKGEKKIEIILIDKI